MMTMIFQPVGTKVSAKFKKTVVCREFLELILTSRKVRGRLCIQNLPQQIDLQVLNNICMDRILLSDKACAEFASHRPIASGKKSICREITSLKKKISILI